MIKASIISIGDELLTGEKVDTNSNYLSRQLFELSIPVGSKYTVGDEINDIYEMINYASEKSEIIFLTGGLGPTEDDVTRHAIAKFLDTELVLNEKSLGKIKEFFKSRKKKMPERNIIQAKFPKGSKPMDNALGTAPGILVENGNLLLAAFPGVPSEMKSMFGRYIFGRLENISRKQSVVIKKIKCIGVGESTVAEILGDIMERSRNPLINCTVSSGIITLYVISKAETRQDALKAVNIDVKLLKEKLGNIVFGEDEQTLEEVTGTKLKEKGLTLSLAESCTGGLIAKLITDVPGSSEYFKQGWVTYSNDSKVQELGVPAEIIEEYGAVSPQTAEAMADGAREQAKADISLAVTGIAGPSGGSEQKPAGTVYITLNFKGEKLTKKYEFSRGRNFVRIRTAQTALNLLRHRLVD